MNLREQARREALALNRWCSTDSFAVEHHIFIADAVSDIWEKEIKELYSLIYEALKMIEFFVETQGTIQDPLLEFTQKLNTFMTERNV